MSEKKKDRFNNGGYDPNIYNAQWQLTPTWGHNIEGNNESNRKRNKKHK